MKNKQQHSSLLKENNIIFERSTEKKSNGYHLPLNSLPIEPMDFQLNLTLTDAFVSNGNRKLYLFRMGFDKEWKVSGLAWWER